MPIPIAHHEGQEVRTEQEEDGEKRSIGLASQATWNSNPFGRSKQYRKLMKEYQLGLGLFEPYQVLGTHPPLPLRYAL